MTDLIDKQKLINRLMDMGKQTICYPERAHLIDILLMLTRGGEFDASPITKDFESSFKNRPVMQDAYIHVCEKRIDNIPLKFNAIVDRVKELEEKVGALDCERRRHVADINLLTKEIKKLQTEKQDNKWCSFNQGIVCPYKNIRSAGLCHYCEIYIFDHKKQP